MSNENMLSIGSRIAKLRMERGLSQKQLADELEKIGLKVRRETVTQWENGTRDLKTEYTIKLADFFGVTCDYILRGIESENVSISKVTGLTNESINKLKRINGINWAKSGLNSTDPINSFIGGKGFVGFLLAFLDYQLEVMRLLECKTYFLERLDGYEESIPQGKTVYEYAAELSLERGSCLHSEAYSLLRQNDNVNYRVYRLEQALRRIVEAYQKEAESNGCVTRSQLKRLRTS